MMSSVLVNLLDNAWKYTGAASDATIRVRACEAEGRSGFCVADNGAGFDMAHGSRLFKAFQRLHRQDEVAAEFAGGCSGHRVAGAGHLRGAVEGPPVEALDLRGLRGLCGRRDEHQGRGSDGCGDDLDLGEGVVYIVNTC